MNPKLKNNKSIFAAITLIVVLGVFLYMQIKKQELTTKPTSTTMRSEIKNYIDELSGFSIQSIEHTTEAIEQEKKRKPLPPQIFESGRYMVTFSKGSNKKYIIFQTEEKVGHMVKVIPGQTNIGGFVQLANSKGEDKEKLNDEELDYIIKTLYKMFDKPLVDSKFSQLNLVKDYALAIKFSTQSGIDNYHGQLINNIK